MAHLADKLAEFFYEELPPGEMTAARQHIQGCAECRHQIEQFERTHLALKASPDFEPPSRVVLSLPDRRPWFGWSGWFDWRQVVTASGVAALVAGFVVAFSPAPTPVTVSVPAAAPVVVQAEKVDYSRIVNEVQQSDRSWFAGELQKRDQEIKRLQGELAYYENFQRTVMRETLENGTAIQLLAQRTDLRGLNR
jgi:hypothetical protein